MNAYEKDVDEKEFEEILNINYKPITICGIEFEQGTALRELDPTAFDCIMAEETVIWVCDWCGCEFDDLDEANECCEEEE